MARSTHKFEYNLLLIIQTIVSLVPRKLALRFGAFAGYLLYLSGAYKTICIKNMTHVNLCEPSQMPRVMRKLYKNMGRYAVDFLRKGKLPFCTVHNFELLDEFHARGKGTVALLGHFGNWELLAKIFGSNVSDLNVVAKPMRNRLVEEWLAKKRASTSAKTIHTQRAVRKMYEVIKRNGMLAILIDQFVGGQGTMVPFLGKDANTTRAVAGLTRKTGCVVMPTYALIDEKDNYDVYLFELPTIDVNGMNDDQLLFAHQKQQNDILSSWIRQHPEHWFGWFHKRYRGSVKY